MQKYRHSPADSAVETAIQAIKEGRMVIVADDQDRENEGDLIMAAALARPEDVNFMARQGRGLICASIDSATAARLQLQVESGPQGALHGTAFTASLDLVAGCSSGISAADRAATLRALANPAAGPGDFARPGHLFPLLARPGGVLERRGHTEAAQDLCLLAGLPPVGVLCELMDDDGSMVRLPGLEQRARDWNLPLVTVQDLARYRLARSPLAPNSTPVRLPRPAGDLWLCTWAIPGQAPETWPLVAGKGLHLPAPDAVPLVRVHSECLTGEALGSLRCDCGAQLRQALDLVSASQQGAVIYLRQEGRGIGLAAKLQAYALQDQGLDTWEANVALGHQPDGRSYQQAAWILHSLGWTSIRLVSNNPAKVTDLEHWGIQVRERLGSHVGRHPENRQYLATKASRFGHHPAPETIPCLPTA